MFCCVAGSKFTLASSEKISETGFGMAKPYCDTLESRPEEK
jgi:hypothetical protein